jgi:hypothetical protein
MGRLFGQNRLITARASDWHPEQGDRMSVYLIDLYGIETKLTKEAVRDRFLEKVGPPPKPRQKDTRLPFIAIFLAPAKPDINLLNEWSRAIQKFTALETPKYTINFQTGSDRVVMYKGLFHEIVKAFPEGPLLQQAAAAAAQREAEANQASEEARQEARTTYNHILNATVSDKTYGAKLAKLIQGGWARLGEPDLSEDVYLSKTEKKTVGNNVGMKPANENPFGVKRLIEGILADEHEAEDRLELHLHCQWNGVIAAASIQKASESGQNGITKRWLETSSYVHFQSPDITRKNLFG